ncbi:MAG: hypothetical protein AAF465_06520 [Pseudomonadota bacterium]
MNLVRTLVLFTLATVATNVMAESQPISVNTAAEKEERYVDADGVERSRLVPVTTVIPGDQVVYTITFANQGTQRADGIKIVDPIPAQMRYIESSAFGPGTTISFSADGGQTFAAANAVMIEDNGTARVASPTEYTHIQWLFNSSLEPGAQGYAQFKAQLK